MEFSNFIYSLSMHIFIYCLLIKYIFKLDRNKNKILLLVCDLVAIILIIFLFKSKDIIYVVVSGLFAHLDYKKDNRKN